MDLDRYIVETAKAGIDGEELIGKFAWTEIFFTIVSSDRELSLGPQTTTEPISMRISMVNAPQGRLAMFFTTKDDPRRGPKFAGIPLIKALEMVQGMPEVDGLMIQSAGEGWISMDKKMMAQVINGAGLRRR
jgi:hypothetical protein